MQRGGAAVWRCLVLLMSLFAGVVFVVRQYARLVLCRFCMRWCHAALLHALRRNRLLLLCCSPAACSQLPSWGLTGTLPARLNLEELKILDLSNNQLDGSLPASLSLKGLQVRASGDPVLVLRANGMPLMTSQDVCCTRW